MNAAATHQHRERGPESEGDNTSKWGGRSSGAWLKIERKSQRIPSAVPLRCRESLPILRSRRTLGRDPQSLNIGYRFTMKGRKPRSRVQDERPRQSGSWRETMTILGRVLGSQSQISQSDLTGSGFIEQVQDLLFGGARARDIKDVVVGELYNLSDALPGFGCVSGFHSRKSRSACA